MTENTEAGTVDHSFIKGGLLYRLLSQAGLELTGPAAVRQGIILTIGIAYVPMLLFALMQNVAYNPSIKIPFLVDIIALTRFVLVAPLLLIAEEVVEPWLVMVTKQATSKLMPEALPAYEAMLANSTRWRDSHVAEILLFLSVFGMQWVEAGVLPSAHLTTWQLLPGTQNPTLVFWYLYVANPLVRFLWVRWLWRYIIWTIYLCRLASLQLKLMPTHPDSNGGLAFIAIGHSRFASLAFTLGLQASAIMAQQIVFLGKNLLSFEYELVGLLVIVFIVFLAPLLVFSKKLVDSKRLGLFQYGELADQYSADFHSKWIGNKQDDVLIANDIQSLTAMGSTYSVVAQMKCCLINKNNAITFAAATLIPFTPLVLSVYPFDQLLNHLLKNMM